MTDLEAILSFQSILLQKSYNRLQKSYNHLDSQPENKTKKN